MIKRIISAAILIPIVIWLVLFANHIYFAVAIIFISLGAYMEWLNMDSTAINFTKSIYLACGAVFLFVFIFYTNHAIYALLLVFLIHTIISFSSLKKDEFILKHYMFSGILYVSLYSFLYFLMTQNNGRTLLMLLFVSIWAGDSFAYFCGKKFGKHKLAKFISPKKTKEGAVCGVVLGSIFGAFFAYFFHLPIAKMLFVAFIANITGIAGDLAESVVKRAFGKKDSSNIIPGHGGILDRLDSVAFAGFFIYIIISWKIL